MKHILLVEDDNWLSDLYGAGLERISDTVVHTAQSAEDALGVLDKNRVDLLVLDMFLGQFNGIEFIHELKTYSDTRQLPVMVLSSVQPNDFGMSEARWREYNVVKYLYKPTTKPDDLIAEVRKYFAGLKS